MYYVRTGMKKLLFSIGFLVVCVVASSRVLGQQPGPPRPKVLAFFTVAGELDHWLFAQQAMRAFGARAGEGGYVFAATSDWDALNDANLQDVRVVIWLNDMVAWEAMRAADGGG